MAAICWPACRPARTVAGAETAARWQAALEDAHGPPAADAADMLPLPAASTGYSPEMLTAALAGRGPGQPGVTRGGARLPAHLAAPPRTGRRMPRPGGLGALLPAGRRRARLGPAVAGHAPLFRPAPPVDLTLGYAAGNVPGTALIIALLGGLAEHAARAAAPAPAVVVRNSRHEPLFTPWVLSAVEAVDPDLVAGLAVMIWDYDDPALQGPPLPLGRAHAGRRRRRHHRRP